MQSLFSLPQRVHVAPPPLTIPSIEATLQAGFPSPAADHEEKRIDLNDILIRNPPATFYIRVSGDSMKEAGIDDGDHLIVDKSIKPSHGRIIVACIDNQFTVKRLYQRNNQIKLIAANPDYPDIVLKDPQELIVWGVVIHVIKTV